MKKALKTVAGAVVGYCLLNLAIAVGEAMPIVIALDEERYHDADMLVHHYRMAYGPCFNDLADSIGVFAGILTNGMLKLRKEKRRVDFKAYF